MSEKTRTVNFPAGHEISEAEEFFKYQGCLFEDCSEHGIPSIKMIFPAGTTSAPVNPHAMEYQQLLTFPDGMEVLEIQLRGRGSGPPYSQILRSEETQEKRRREHTHGASHLHETRSRRLTRECMETSGGQERAEPVTSF